MLPPSQRGFRKSLSWDSGWFQPQRSNISEWSNSALKLLYSHAFGVFGRWYFKYKKNTTVQKGQIFAKRWSYSAETLDPSCSESIPYLCSTNLCTLIHSFYILFILDNYFVLVQTTIINILLFLLVTKSFIIFSSIFL